MGHVPLMPFEPTPATDAPRTGSCAKQARTLKNDNFKVFHSDIGSRRVRGPATQLILLLAMQHLL
jgi:hypothetical protein